jgi:hypothetical protein
MPFGDRTGPFGLGPRTGRAMGYCAGFPGPGSMNPIPGRGWFEFGRGFGCFGRGRGWRNRFWATGSPGWARAGSGYGYIPFTGAEYSLRPEFTAKDEIDILKDKADFFRQQLDEIQKRISTLEKS